MHDTFEGSLNTIAEAVVRRGAAPMAACGFARRRNGQWISSFSQDNTAFFDLASLTKPFTAVACALVPNLLDRPLGEALPQLASAPVARRAIADFLSHRSGLAAHVPLFLAAVSGGAVSKENALREAASSLHEGAREAPFPSHAVYSDLGYILAGEALAMATRTANAGAALEEGLLRSLDLGLHVGTAQGLCARHRDAASRFVPTESTPWRGGVLRGAVHDDNAWALTGSSASGHAGLFGTVQGVLQFASAVLDGWIYADGSLRHLPFGRLLEEHRDSTWRMGFDGKSRDGSSTAGQTASARSIGHLGFTGTSLWIDPDRCAATVLLTNRVHPSREFQGLRDLRGVVHEALFAVADRA